MKNTANIRPESGTPGYYDFQGMDPNTYIKIVFDSLENVTPYQAYLLGQIIKYASRFNQKDGSEDGEKILYYAKLIHESTITTVSTKGSTNKLAESKEQIKFGDLEIDREVPK